MQVRPQVSGESIIRTFPDQWKDEFLDPTESNFTSVLDKLAWMFGRLQEDQPKRPGRRAVDPWFRYREALQDAHLSPGSRDFEEAAELSLAAFEGCIRWHHPDALYNITPSPLLDTVALAALTALYNPNAIGDITAGKFILKERTVMRYLTGLAGWNPETSGGLFTYGGKATLLYAIRAGLNRCDRASIKKGLRGDYVVITTDSSHFSIESVCNYAGIGHNNCLRVPTTNEGIVDVIALKESIEHQIAMGKKVACILLSGGGTMNLSIDPVRTVSDMLDGIVARYALDYRPYLHLDAVISWVWLFLADADYNRLGVTDEVATRLKKTARAVTEVAYADSFGADFHKTGLSPYNSSCFVCKSGAELFNLNSAELVDNDDECFGDVRNFERTLENSRPVLGIISASHVIERLGIEGFQQYLAYSVSVCEQFRKVVREQHANILEVINTDTLGFEVVVKVHFQGDMRSYQEICTAPAADRAAYRQICDEFFEYVHFGQYCNTHAVPFIGYVPKYKFGNNPGGYPAFLLYPVSVHMTDEAVAGILDRLADAISQFEEAKATGAFLPRKVLEGVKEPPK